MDIEGALVWLGEHQPLPTDIEMTQEIADQFDEIRKLFLMHSDSRCIPLFLNAFGGRNGWGMYQLIGDVLKKYPSHEILPHLLEGLKSSNQYVKQWCAEIATSFPDPSLVSPLAALLGDQNYDVKSSTIIALQQIQDMRVRSILEVYYQHEEDESLRELIGF
ncbi:HEAT repeat domain-containing protein [Spirosoma endophyticum]|uniref:HEAT repeat-containing protein n=1 Tax=Spirosoma endophyticum TaxID=662367 RepID=A0A1I2HZL8_9BACT|nr:HEAT repeat domain-containing protein [Spirosoma endophyticum]SFF34810.1 HEAT repeat-containing protein [Spirosoma endophyticum]